jgi:glycosyltransferase involved in cell wall biosynthesis
VLALADSEYNKQDLLEAGYASVQVQPILIPYTLQEVKPDATVMASADDGANLLFVGRLAPNKRCEDIVKVLHQYRQIEPGARLFLVGARRYTQRYVDWLHDFIHQLGLEGSVIFTGHVSQEALAAYYRIADVFVMMSEHEGFGIPLIESMRFGVPIVAYASTAVPETLGGSGILIHQKQFSVIAELIHLLRTDSALRSRIVERQRARVQDFAPEAVLAQFRHHIEKAVNAL